MTLSITIPIWPCQINSKSYNWGNFLFNVLYVYLQTDENTTKLESKVEDLSSMLDSMTSDVESKV